MNKTTIIAKNNEGKMGPANAYKMKLMVFTLLTMMCLSLNACETIAGAGRDIEKAGSAIQNAAN